MNKFQVMCGKWAEDINTNGSKFHARTRDAAHCGRRTTDTQGLKRTRPFMRRLADPMSGLAHDEIKAAGLFARFEQFGAGLSGKRLEIAYRTGVRRDHAQPVSYTHL